MAWWHQTCQNQHPQGGLKKQVWGLGWGFSCWKTWFQLSPVENRSKWQIFNFHIKFHIKFRKNFHLSTFAQFSIGRLGWGFPTRGIHWRWSNFVKMSNWQIFKFHIKFHIKFWKIFHLSTFDHFWFWKLWHGFSTEGNPLQASKQENMMLLSSVIFHESYRQTH